VFALFEASQEKLRAGSTQHKLFGEAGKHFLLFAMIESLGKLWRLPEAG